MASDTSQSDSQGWWWQKVKKLGIVAAIHGAPIFGAALGTVILPGVGTVAGAYIGQFLLFGTVVYYMLAERDYTPYERRLLKQGWMPFGIQKVDVGPEGGTIKLQSKPDSRIHFDEDVIQLEVPKDAVRSQGGGKVPIRYGVLLNGKFKLKTGYKLVSPVVYVSYDSKDTTKPFKLQLPHWSSDKNVFIATSPQDNNERGDITFYLKEEMVSSSSRNAAVLSTSGSELFALAVEESSKSNFYAIPHEIPMKNGRGVELSVIISYASNAWYEILCEHYFPDGNFPYPCPVFQFRDSSIQTKLAKDCGPGWEAKLCGYSKIGLKHIDEDSYDINDGDQLKNAVTSKRYPPRFVYKVTWTAEAEESRQQKQVQVFIEGSDQELSFSCMTFEAPVRGPSKVYYPYSRIRARDVLQNFKSIELLRDVKDMLTKTRVYILKKQYKLIDSSCHAKIRSDLEKGDPNSAAITLIEYFEANHNGNDLLRFCEFLGDEAEEAGGSSMLDNLAFQIQSAVEIKGHFFGPRVEFGYKFRTS